MPTPFEPFARSHPSFQYIKENAGAAAVKLSQQEVASVRKIAEVADKMPGDRFQPGWREIAFVETPALTAEEEAKYKAAFKSNCGSHGFANFFKRGHGSK